MVAEYPGVLVWFVSFSMAVLPQQNGQPKLAFGRWFFLWDTICSFGRWDWLAWSAVTYFPLIILPGPTSCPLWGTFSCSDFGCLPWLSGFSGFIVCLRFFISRRVACAKVLRCFCCSRLPCCYWFL